MADTRQVARVAELHALDPQQLLSAKQRIEEDIQRFAESANFLSKSASIYMGASTAIKQLAESSEGSAGIVVKHRSACSMNRGPSVILTESPHVGCSSQGKKS
jgi:hypothetical protein